MDSFPNFTQILRFAAVRKPFFSAPHADGDSSSWHKIRRASEDSYLGADMSDRTERLDWQEPVLRFHLAGTPSYS